MLKVFKSNKSNVSFLKRNYDLVAVIQLINKHFWKSKIGPISSLSLPLFYMVVYKILPSSSENYFINGLISYFSFCILPLCLITLPQMIVELKTSIILRKISVSRISSFKFCFVLLLYYFLALSISCLIIVLMFAIFLNVDAPKVFSNIKWGQVVYSLLNTYIVSLSLGLLYGVLIKKSVYVQIAGFISMIISAFLSGQFLPMSVISSTDVLRYLSLFSPETYCLGLLNSSILKSADVNFTGIFDINNFLIMISKSKKIIVYEKWQILMNLTMPYLLTSLFLFISLKKFNWTSR